MAAPDKVAAVGKAHHSEKSADSSWTVAPDSEAAPGKAGNCHQDYMEEDPHPHYNGKYHYNYCFYYIF